MVGGMVNVIAAARLAGVPVNSAESAKMRLMGIIAVDRRAVPAWRWVCVRKRLEPSRRWIPPTLDSFETDRRFRRARYRWEMRT